jgi:hypothetical protein
VTLRTSPNRSAPSEASGVRRQASSTTVATQPRDERAAPRKARVNPQEKRAIISSVALALREKNFPSIPERVKDIMAAQIGDLLRGGFQFEDIRKAAVELALSWDEKRGHNRLCHLASRVRAAYWNDEQKAHAARMVDDRAVGPAIAGIIPDIAGRSHPNAHPFATNGSGSCSVCGGPVGVHVRRIVEVV